MLADEAWESVLLTLKKKGQFRLSELPFEGGELVSISIKLRHLEHTDWIEREGDVWKPGEKARRLMDLDKADLIDE